MKRLLDPIMVLVLKWSIVAAFIACLFIGISLGTWLLVAWIGSMQH